MPIMGKFRLKKWMVWLMGICAFIIFEKVLLPMCPLDVQSIHDFCYWGFFLNMLTYGYLFSFKYKSIKVGIFLGLVFLLIIVALINSGERVRKWFVKISRVIVILCTIAIFSYSYYFTAKHCLERVYRENSFLAEFLFKVNFSMSYLLFFVGIVCLINRKCTLGKFFIAFPLSQILALSMWIILLSTVVDGEKSLINFFSLFMEGKKSLINLFVEVLSVFTLAALWNCLWLGGIIKKYRYCLILYFFSAFTVTFLMPRLPD
jgi:hypothetical protein